MSKKLKRAIPFISSVILVGTVTVMMLFALTPNEAKAAENNAGTAGTIDVTGNGSVKVKPDIAVLNIGVTSNGETTSVQNENTKTMDKVIAAVKTFGIKDDDIKTVSYSMNPNYDYSNGKYDKIIGYTVYNVIEVKIRDISKAGDVLAAANGAGANVNNGISFRLSDVDAYYKQALEKAVADAKGKADVIAKALGVSVRLPVRVSENNSYYSPIIYGNYAVASEAAHDSAAAVPVEQGMLEVTASVSVSYNY